MNVPTLPALGLAAMIALAAALATGPSAHHDSHHPPEMIGTERAFARVAASLAQRWGYPR